MRKINKGEAPQQFSEYVRKEMPKTWEDFRKCEQHDEVYAACMEQLMHEQHGLSGYTEIPVEENANLHIDHFRRRGVFQTPQNCFDWNNLIADEHNPNYGADFKDKHISQKEAYKKLINPVVEDPHYYLTYQTNGQIVAKAELDEKGKERADFTIRMFNLKHPSLVQRREVLIKLVRDYKMCGLTDGEIAESLKEFGFLSVVEYALSVPV